MHKNITALLITLFIGPFAIVLLPDVVLSEGNNTKWLNYLLPLLNSGQIELLAFTGICLTLLAPPVIAIILYHLKRKITLALVLNQLVLIATTIFFIYIYFLLLMVEGDSMREDIVPIKINIAIGHLYPLIFTVINSITLIKVINLKNKN